MFALSAADAVRSFAMSVGVHLIIEIAVPVLVLLFGIQAGEQIATISKVYKEDPEEDIEDGQVSILDEK